MLKVLLDYTSKNTASIPQSTSWPWWQPPLVVIGLFAGRSLILFTASIALGSANNKAMLSLQAHIFRRILSAELSFFQKESTSSLINTLRNEGSQAGSAFISVVQEGGKNLITALSLLAYLFWLNWQLTFLVLTLLPFVAWAIRKIGQRLRKVHQSLVKSAEEINYVIEENAQAHRFIRLHGAQNQQINRFNGKLDFTRGQLARSLAASAAMTPITQITAAIAFALILSLALHQNAIGTTSVGAFTAYLGAMLMLIAPVKNLGDVVPNFQRGKVSLERIFSILDYPEESLGGNYSHHQLTQDIIFNQVTKQYPNSTRPALQSVSFRIKPGQMVALVGASGSGKTTLANLLPRFLPFESGDILINGVSSHEWQLPSLRKMMAIVSQDTVLLNDTVLANIALGDDAPDREQAKAALVQAHLWDHISTLAGRIDAVIGHNGQTMSGGQRQRLAIARAFYRAAPILILDEATSALDSESERLVQDAINTLTQSRTTLVIAHRLSTVRHADSIIVMQQGAIAEQGTYEELIAKNGVFTKLVQLQLSGST
jgi:ATP-binding cassette, subfamily B, bacterial MsbA